MLRMLNQAFAQNEKRIIILAFFIMLNNKTAMKSEKKEEKHRVEMFESWHGSNFMVYNFSFHLVECED